VLEPKPTSGSANSSGKGVLCPILVRNLESKCCSRAFRPSFAWLALALSPQACLRSGYELLDDASRTIGGQHSGGVSGNSTSASRGTLTTGGAMNVGGTSSMGSGGTLGTGGGATTSSGGTLGTGGGATTSSGGIGTGGSTFSTSSGGVAFASGGTAGSGGTTSIKIGGACDWSTSPPNFGTAVSVGAPNSALSEIDPVVS